MYRDRDRRQGRGCGATRAFAGRTPADIVKVTLAMERIEDYKAIDEIYAAWLPPRGEMPLPARTAFAKSLVWSDLPQPLMRAWRLWFHEDR